MAYFRIKSRMLSSYCSIPGTAAPLIGLSCCAGGVTGGVTGAVVSSPPQESRTASPAIRIVVIVIDLPETLRTRFIGTARDEQLGKLVHTVVIDSPWSPRSEFTSLTPV